MKKLIIAVLGVLLFSPVAFADNWGAGLKFGAGQNDPKMLKDAYDEAHGTYNSRELDKNAGYFGLEFLHEWDLDEIGRIGAKIGWDGYGQNELELKRPADPSWSKIEATEHTDAFPITLYYKQDYGVNHVSWFAGAGITIMHSKIKVKHFGSESKNKVFPHIVVGGEYRFTEVFALGLEARYNIAAKVKKDGEVLSDRSGFGGALTCRFYF